MRQLVSFVYKDKDIHARFERVADHWLMTLQGSSDSRMRKGDIGTIEGVLALFGIDVDDPHEIVAGTIRMERRGIDD